jgi:uncharacterized protein (DUF1015 family)
MPLIKPFAALRPAPGRATEVAAPPYDVMSTAEARQMVVGHPDSFLHVSRAEVDLPAATDPYAEAVYAKARDNLDRLMADGVLIRDPAPRYYAYRLTMGGHRQLGLAATASVAAYDGGRIKKHELTRPAKEDDRVRHITALNAQTGPVFLTHRANEPLEAALGAIADGPAEVAFAAADGVRHEIWPIADPALVAELTAVVDGLDALYVADGHHRSAAASRVAASRRGSAGVADAASGYFLAVLFPHDQMQVLPYNRVVRDLNGLDAAAFLNRAAASFEITAAEQPVQPTRHGEFGLYLEQAWYRLRIAEDLVPARDPVARLDVSLLQRHLIEPILGIADPRRDERIDFVGGIRGLDGLTARVDSGGMRLAFSLRATSVTDLMAVADADRLMPPKSTWFEPKLADGLLSHVLD